MKTLVCKSCGYHTYRESAVCPNCRRKDLVVRDSMRTTGTYSYADFRPVAVSGSHPLVSLLAITGVSTLFSLIAYSHMIH